MKNRIILIGAFVTSMIVSANAQDKVTIEKFGNTLNIGAGVGYFGYVGHSVPAGIINYEFNVAHNFTLAPFAGMYSYQNYYYWGNPTKPLADPSYRKYSYRETDAPLGIKGIYYFDELLKANPKWDFYVGASVGFIFRSVIWESDYAGDKNVYQSSSRLYLDAHIGAEYHLSEHIGLFADLSTGFSSVGMALHFNK